MKIKFSNWFSGNWNLLWVGHRYWRTALRGKSFKKILNAFLALIEMRLGVVNPISSPMVLRLEPTNVCNLNCPRCSTGLGKDGRKKGYINLEKVRTLLEEVKKNIVFVRLDGNGEPLLHPEIIPLIKLIKSYNIAVTLSSHFNNIPVGGIYKLVESGLDRIVIAIDGSTQEIYEKYRVGGNLNTVLANLAELRDAKKSLNNDLIIDLQFLDWGYNSHQIPEMKIIAQKYCLNSLTVIRPDWAVTAIRKMGKAPKRCFWLWGVLTVDWQFNYHSCTNAWTYPFPNLSYKEFSVQNMWKSKKMIQARKYNVLKLDNEISRDLGCMCNRCTDMLVIPRPNGYVCE